MKTTIIIAITITLLLALFAAVYFLRKKKKGCEEKETNYMVFFIIGCSWLPIGLATDNHTFTLMGAFFLIFGLINKDKWKNDEEKWKDLSPKRKRVIRAVLFGLVLLVVVAVVAVFIFSQVS
jgi:hypothetical protein